MSLRSPLLLALAAVTIATVIGCQAQGEGGLCNKNAGNSGQDDCQSGLTCQSRPAVVMMKSFGICCKPSGQSTTSACSGASPSLNASPAPPTDTDAGPQATEEAGADAVPADDADDAADTGTASDASDATLE